MSASVFLDTNILIYAIEDTMPLSARTAKARAVVAYWVLRRPDPIHRAPCRLQGRVFGRPEPTDRTTET